MKTDVRKTAKKLAESAFTAAPELSDAEVMDALTAITEDGSESGGPDQGSSGESARRAMAIFYAVVRAAGPVENLVGAFCERHASAPALVALATGPGRDAASAVMSVMRMIVGFSMNLERTMPSEVRSRAVADDPTSAIMSIWAKEGRFAWSSGEMQGEKMEIGPVLMDAATRHGLIPQELVEGVCELVWGDVQEAKLEIPRLVCRRRGNIAEYEWLPPRLVVTAEDLAMAQEDFERVQREAPESDEVEIKIDATPRAAISAYAAKVIPKFSEFEVRTDSPVSERLRLAAKHIQFGPFLPSERDPGTFGGAGISP